MERSKPTYTWAEATCSPRARTFSTYRFSLTRRINAGRVPKQIPASFEAYLFRGKSSSHIIETEIGRIGVGICYDNAFRFLADALIVGDADILLNPYCAPTPQRLGFTLEAG